MKPVAEHRSPRPNLNLRLLHAAAFFAFITILAISPGTKAEENGWVEVRSQDEVFSPYRERRENHGWLFFAGQEYYMPTSYVSKVGDDQTYDTMFGKTDLALASLEGGYKYNFSVGSVALLGGYATGQLESARIGETRFIQMDRISVKLMLLFDTLMSEPYVAPYISMGLYQFGIDEKVPSISFKASGNTGMGMLTTVGALIQLNWIEEDVARWALMAVGLENTYVDLFVTQHGKTSKGSDPGTQTAFNLGAGLRIEF